MGVAVLEMSNGSEYKKGSENLSLFESLSRFAPCKGIQKPWKFCLWNPESEQICTGRIWNPGHWNPEYKFRWQQIRNQVPENRNPWHRIKKPRPSWILSHGRRLIKLKKVAVSTEWKAAKVRYPMCVTSLSIPCLLASQSPLNLPWPPQVLFLQKICLRWQVGKRAPLKQFNFALYYTRAGPYLCRNMISPQSTKNT